MIRRSSVHQILLLSSISYYLIACSPTYQSSRAYLPQHTEGKQLLAELGTSQLDVSYSVTDHIQVNLGGIYEIREGTAEAKSADEATLSRLEKSTLAGGQLGVGYFMRLSPQSSKFISFNMGTAIQKWTFTREGDEFLTDLGYDNFNANIINPHAQLGFTWGNQVDHIGLALRYEKPMFTFRGLDDKILEDQANPQLLNVVIQTKHSLKSISERFSIFGQFIYRYNFDQSYFESADSQYDISSMNLYLGISYAMGFAPSDEGEAPKGIEVEHQD